MSLREIRRRWLDYARNEEVVASHFVIDSMLKVDYESPWKQYSLIHCRESLCLPPKWIIPVRLEPLVSLRHVKICRREKRRETNWTNLWVPAISFLLAFLSGKLNRKKKEKDLLVIPVSLCFWCGHKTQEATCQLFSFLHSPHHHGTQGNDTVGETVRGGWGELC